MTPDIKASRGKEYGQINVPVVLICEVGGEIQAGTKVIYKGTPDQKYEQAAQKLFYAMVDGWNELHDRTCKIPDQASHSVSAVIGGPGYPVEFQRRLFRKKK